MSDKPKTIFRFWGIKFNPLYIQGTGHRAYIQGIQGTQGIYTGHTGDTGD